MDRLKRRAGDARGRITPGVTHAGGYASMRPGLTLEGVVYDRGEQIPNDVVARCRNASALLSRRWIVPVTQEQIALARHSRHLMTPTPTHLHHSEARAHLEA